MHPRASRSRSVTGLASLLAAGVGACTLVASLLTGAMERLAPIWSANPLVLRALLLQPHRRWGALIAAGVFGDWTGDLLLGDSAIQLRPAAGQSSAASEPALSFSSWVRLSASR